MARSRDQTDVAIVGGGPVGLTAALALSRFGISTTVVERDPGPTRHPKARGLAVRTMEIFRTLGLEDAIRSYELPPESRRFIWVKSFTGEELARVSVRAPDDLNFSPCNRAIVAQNWVEQVLYERAQEDPNIRLLHHTSVSGFEVLNDSVELSLESEGKGAGTLFAHYVIGADGASSLVREELGVRMEGEDNLGHFCNAFCEVDLTPWVADRPCAGFFFADPKLMPHVLLSVDGRRLWLFGTRFFPENGESVEMFTPEYCASLLRKVLGLPDLDVKVLNIASWVMAAQIAKRFRVGNIFLAGDAAHRLPPMGGMGMNTGIQDAYNLAWKLAAVIDGWASDSLLDSYHLERMPVARTTIAWSVQNAEQLHAVYESLYKEDLEEVKQHIAAQYKQLQSLGLDLGASYAQGALVSDGTEPHHLDPENYHPSASPGSRAPHLLVTSGGKEISILDLFGNAFVFLAGPLGEEWRVALHELELSPDLPLYDYRVGSDGDLIDTEHDFCSLYGIEPSGAVLIRPDGYVAWRSKELVAKPAPLLSQAFTQILGHVYSHHSRH